MSYRIEIMQYVQPLGSIGYCVMVDWYNDKQDELRGYFLINSFKLICNHSIFSEVSPYAFFLPLHFSVFENIEKKKSVCKI